MSDTIYRFKLSSELTTPMTEFANTHRFDEIPAFRESWDRWCYENSEIIETEKTRLENIGCEKDIQEKMYKSVRYYFKNKSSEKRKPKKRRQYIALDCDVLDTMNSHIDTQAFPNNYKPEFAYNNFVSNQSFNEGLDEEIRRLQTEYQLTEIDAEKKIKKTYKNRYYLKQKRSF
jgi:hypothetical protein|tara:strand:+ start:2185 stop:2706 length:522 start_codon:yes stop_codon:yes gene_type:complete